MVAAGAFKGLLYHDSGAPVGTWTGAAIEAILSTEACPIGVLLSIPKGSKYHYGIHVIKR